MREKIKNWIIGALFATVAIAGIGYFSAETTNASTTYVEGDRITYDVVTISGSKVAVFKYGNQICAVKL